MATVEVVKTEPVYKLTLSKDEAQFLSRLIGFHVNGPGTGRKGHPACDIYTALDAAGVRSGPEFKTRPEPHEGAHAGQKNIVWVE